MHKLTFILLTIGGLNWLIFGLSGWDVGHLFGGMDAMVSRAIYVLVGLSAIYEILTHKKCCSGCAGQGSTPGSTPAPSQM